MIRPEIRKIVLEEQKDLFDFVAKTTPTLFESAVDTAIDLWKLEHARMVSESMVFVRVRGQHAFRDPVASIDYDLERGIAICDAFLFACFSRVGKESGES